MAIFISIFVSLFCYLSCLSPHGALAWGVMGHRVIGQLAEEKLNDKVLAQVQKLLGKDNMADASLWADIVKSNPERNFQFKWHYARIEDGQTYKQSKQKDIVWAINLMIGILKNEQSHEKINKTQALKLLIHFVGDIHQPLHASREIDHGGSKIKVKFFSDPQLYNLHRIWDSTIIEFFRLSYTELTDYVQRHYTESVAQKSPQHWINESAHLRPYAYFFDNIYIETPPVLISHKDLLKKYPNMLKLQFSTSRKPRGVPHIHYQYVNRTLPIMLKRLHEAGMRLAHLLNEIL